MCKECKNKPYHMVAFGLLIIGGLNWLLMAIFGNDLGSWLGGQTHWFWRLVYLLVGIAAIYEIITHAANCTCCTHTHTDEKSTPTPTTPSTPAMS